MANEIDKQLNLQNKAFNEMDKTFLYAINDKPVDSMKHYLIKDFSDLENFIESLMDKYKDGKNLPPLKMTFLEDIEELTRGTYILNSRLADDFFPDPFNNTSSGGGSGIELKSVLTELNTDKHSVLTSLSDAHSQTITDGTETGIIINIDYDYIPSFVEPARVDFNDTLICTIFNIDTSLKLSNVNSIPKLSLNFNSFNPQFHLQTSNNNAQFYFGDGTSIAGSFIAGNGISLSVGSNNSLTISATNTSSFTPSTQLSTLNSGNYSIVTLDTPLPYGYWLRRDEFENQIGFDLSIRYTGISPTGETTVITNNHIASLNFTTSDFSIGQNQTDDEAGFPQRLVISLNDNQKLSTTNIKSKLYSSTIPTISSAADLTPSSTTTEPITYVVAGEIQESASNRTPLFSLGGVSIYSGAEIYFPVRNTTNCYALIMGPLNGDFGIVRYNNGSWSGKQISTASPEK